MIADKGSSAALNPAIAITTDVKKARRSRD
jgi:hypothetical protein